MWVLIVVRLVVNNADFMFAQEFETQQTCENAGQWVESQQKKESIRWTCVKK